MLVKKNCLEKGRGAFVNEYNFLKYIRHKVFPYISKYYLEEIKTFSSEQNGGE